MPVPHMKGLIKLIDCVKEAFRMVEEKHGWAVEPVTSAATFSDLQYVQTVIDAVRQSSNKKEWVKVNKYIHPLFYSTHIYDKVDIT